MGIKGESLYKIRLISIKCEKCECEKVSCFCVRDHVCCSPWGTNFSPRANCVACNNIPFLHSFFLYGIILISENISRPFDCLVLPELQWFLCATHVRLIDSPGKYEEGENFFVSEAIELCQYKFISSHDECHEFFSVSLLI